MMSEKYLIALDKWRERVAAHFESPKHVADDQDTCPGCNALMNDKDTLKRRFGVAS